MRETHGRGDKQGATSQGANGLVNGSRGPQPTAIHSELRNRGAHAPRGCGRTRPRVEQVAQLISMKDRNFFVRPGFPRGRGKLCPKRARSGSISEFGFRSRPAGASKHCQAAAKVEQLQFCCSIHFRSRSMQVFMVPVLCIRFGWAVGPTTAGWVPPMRRIPRLLLIADTSSAFINRHTV